MPSAKGTTRRERLARGGDDEEPRSGKPSGGRAPKKLNGWAAVAEKQQEYEREKERREAENDKPREFWLKAGERAVIQFLHDEPYTFNGHSIKNKHGDFKFEPCQLDRQKYCLMCRDGIKQTWKAAFKILDYRGTWDKDKKKFKWDKPIEKIWVVNMTILGALTNQRDKRKKELTEMVLEVSRTGKGKKDTSYNFEPALDEDDERMKPIRHKEEFDDVSELVVSKKDEELIDLGFDAPEDDD